eukprot:c39301_g1_i1 orf=15-194(-)
MRWFFLVNKPFSIFWGVSSTPLPPNLEISSNQPSTLWEKVKNPPPPPPPYGENVQTNAF